MAKKGYLQLKLREVEKETNDLREDIEKFKLEIKTQKKEWKEAMDNQINTLKPILDSKKVIVNMNNSFLNYIKNNCEAEFKELGKLVKSNFKTLANANQAEFKEWLKVQNANINLHLETSHSAYKSLIKVLNEELNLNLTMNSIDRKKK